MTEPLAFVVTGGRDYFDMKIIWGALDAFHVIWPITKLIHGGATGVDTVCKNWAMVRGVEHQLFLPDWKNMDVPIMRAARNRRGELYNVLAGFNRNQQMIDEGRPDHGLVFPGGDGTADMYSRLVKAGVPRTIVAPSLDDQRIYSLSKEGLWYRPSPRKRK